MDFEPGPMSDKAKSALIKLLSNSPDNIGDGLTLFTEGFLQGARESAAFCVKVVKEEVEKKSV